MDAKKAIVELHDRLVENYNANPTEQGRELMAITEMALLNASENEPRPREEQVAASSVLLQPRKSCCIVEGCDADPVEHYCAEHAKELPDERMREGGSS